MTEIIKDKYAIHSTILFIYFIVISNVRNFYLSFIAIIICLLLVRHPQYLISHVLLTSLFGDYFVAFPGVGMSRIVGGIFVLAVYILKYSNNRAWYVNKRLFLTVGILTVLSIVSCLTSITGSMIPAYVLILNFLIMLAISMLSYEELVEGLNALRINTIIMVLNIFISIISGRAVFYADRLIFHYSLNSNGLGMAMVQLIVIMITLTYFKNIRQNFILSVLIVIGSFFTILLTGSRTSLIATIGSIAIVFFYYGLFNENRKIKVNYLFIPIIMFLGVLYALNHFDIEMFSRFTAESVLETGGSGREEIWMCALNNVFPKYPVWGVGLGVENTVSALSEYGLSNNVGIHNMYITLLIQTGVIGSIIFLTIIIGYTVKALKSIQYSKMMFLPALMLFSALINGIGEEVYAERFIWIAIGIFYVLLKKFVVIKFKILKEKIDEKDIVYNTEYENEWSK